MKTGSEEDLVSNSYRVRFWYNNRALSLNGQRSLELTEFKRVLLQRVSGVDFSKSCGSKLFKSEVFFTNMRWLIVVSLGLGFLLLLVNIFLRTNSKRSKKYHQRIYQSDRFDLVSVKV